MWRLSLTLKPSENRRRQAGGTAKTIKCVMGREATHTHTQCAISREEDKRKTAAEGEETNEEERGEELSLRGE